jgi:3D (Asp-Asp-Asp) domain-containing protein
MKRTIILLFVCALCTMSCGENIISHPTVETVVVKQQHFNSTPKVCEPELIGTFRLTAYCPCYECSEGYGGNTATGTIAAEGRTIAVDPRVIPYGTKVIINGHTYIAEDCGGLIKGNRIDVYFDSHDKVDDFGVRNAEVYKGD